MNKKYLGIIMIVILASCAAALAVPTKSAASLGPSMVSDKERLVFDRPIASRILKQLDPATSGNVPRYFGSTKESDLKIKPFSDGSLKKVTVNPKTRSWQSLSPVTFPSTTLKPTSKAKAAFETDRYKGKYDTYTAAKAQYIMYNNLKIQALKSQGRPK